MSRAFQSSTRPGHRSAANRRRAHAVTRRFAAGPVAASFLVVLLVFGLGFFYLLNESKIATKGYEIQELDARIGELEESNRRLELEAASERSIQNIEQAAKKLNMTDTTAVSYVARSGAEVALAE